jgi:hypothetical protein
LAQPEEGTGAQVATLAAALVENDDAGELAATVFEQPLTP